MGQLLGAMASAVPLFLSIRRDNGHHLWLVGVFPDPCVVCDHGCWGEDRQFRPLLERYPNVHIDTAQYLLDGGIRGARCRLRADRLLYGSGFPESHFGGMMMALKHAQIADGAKSAIAHGNLERLLKEAWS